MLALLALAVGIGAYPLVRRLTSRLERLQAGVESLAAEECARRENAELDGESVTVRGDPRLLRRMIRNLLENAKAAPKCTRG